jgi:hypothetical protein
MVFFVFSTAFVQPGCKGFSIAVHVGDDAKNLVLLHIRAHLITQSQQGFLICLTADQGRKGRDFKE